MYTRANENQIILGEIDVWENEISTWVYFRIFAKLKKLFLRGKNLFERFIGLEFLKRIGNIFEGHLLGICSKKEENREQEEEIFHCFQSSEIGRNKQRK